MLQVFCKTLAAATAGTVMMTLFSYTLSWIQKKNYKEPKNLAALLIYAFPDGPRRLFIVTGWILHFTAGWVFVLAYAIVWEGMHIPATPACGAVIGTLSGLPAIAIWCTILNLHPAPPELDRRAYYLQLLPAHTVFGTFAAIGYNMVHF